MKASKLQNKISSVSYINCMLARVKGKTCPNRCILYNGFPFKHKNNDWSFQRKCKYACNSFLKYPCFVAYTGEFYQVLQLFWKNRVNINSSTSNSHNHFSFKWQTSEFIFLTLTICYKRSIKLKSLIQYLSEFMTTGANPEYIFYNLSSMQSIINNHQMQPQRK